jgi:hypothetical protein
LITEVTREFASLPPIVIVKYWQREDVPMQKYLIYVTEDIMQDVKRDA